MLSINSCVEQPADWLFSGRGVFPLPSSGRGPGLRAAAPAPGLRQVSGDRQLGRIVVKAPSYLAESELEGKLSWKASEFVRNVLCKHEVRSGASRARGDSRSVRVPGEQKRGHGASSLVSWRSRLPSSSFLPPTLPGTGTCRAVGLGSPSLHLHPRHVAFPSP